MAETLNVPEIFGSDVFNEAIMKQRLPVEVYRAWENCIQTGSTLPLDVANEIAEAMKIWALEKGATHYTHWFQPMTGITAEKHDSFISPTGDGRVIMEFSGKELVRGEPDASSFPSGGLRATFEARGYTAWDPTACAFVKDGSLYIPTMFFSYTGDSLDKKTPLLRSLEEVSREAIRILRLFGDTETHRIITCVGAEQEYFLLPKDLYAQREDLRLTGRTLFGAAAPKGQELDDHYFAAIRTRVSEFMQDLDEQLWRLGILSKTKHNEGAPCQHELAPIYTDANKACDDNQLIMRTMKKCAAKHNLVCLLHEKPFAGVNGSGKHNNWSINLDGEKSLLDQGKTPESHARFLLFLVAVIWAVDEYADLLRVSSASASNDQRLGGSEAPPAVISVFLGDQLTDLLTEIETGGESAIRQGGNLRIGVATIPTLPKDISDRNRTSPFAFTGKKFEFRMVGSSMSIADCNVMINTSVAEILSRIAQRLEEADDINDECRRIIRDVMRDHKRVIFNGNNYSDEWRREAEERGLPHIHSSVEAAEALIRQKNVDLFEKHGVFDRKELESRYEIRLESYAKTVNIEANTMVEMTRRLIVPAVVKYSKFLSDALVQMKNTGLAVDVSLEAGLLKEVSAQAAALRAALSRLEKLLEKGAAMTDVPDKAAFYEEKVLPAMSALREPADQLETLLGKDFWPMPTYTDLMYGIL